MSVIHSTKCKTVINSTKCKTVKHSTKCLLSTSTKNVKINIFFKIQKKKNKEIKKKKEKKDLLYTSTPTHSSLGWFGGVGVTTLLLYLLTLYYIKLYCVIYNIIDILLRNLNNKKRPVVHINTHPLVLGLVGKEDGGVGVTTLPPWWVFCIRFFGPKKGLVGGVEWHDDVCSAL